MRHVLAILLISIFIGLSACGADSGGGGEKLDPDLIGQWQTACYAEKSANGVPKSFKRDELSISSSSFLSVIRFYPADDSNCENLRYSSEISSNFFVGSSLVEMPDIRSIDITPVKTRITPASDEVAKVFNQQPNAYCNLSDWNAGVSRDVTGRSCAASQDVIYDIYRREDNTLVFGYIYGEDIGNRADRRPKTLDQDRVFQKV